MHLHRLLLFGLLQYLLGKHPLCHLFIRQAQCPFRQGSVSYAHLKAKMPSCSKTIPLLPYFQYSLEYILDAVEQKSKTTAYYQLLYAVYTVGTVPVVSLVTYNGTVFVFKEHLAERSVRPSFTCQSGIGILRALPPVPKQWFSSRPRCRSQGSGAQV